jgi:hypothetical protein
VEERMGVAGFLDEDGLTGRFTVLKLRGNYGHVS